MEQAFVGVHALTASSEQLDNIVFDAFREMQETFRYQIIDGDDTISTIDDIEAMCLEENINKAINTDLTDWWCRRFEEQAHRVAKMPILPFHHYLAWHRKISLENNVLGKRVRRKEYAGTNLSERQCRRIFNRSVRLFERMFGTETARRFVGGHHILIHGTHYVWKLRIETRTILYDTVNPAPGHTPFSIVLCDHELNILAHACVLFSNTPILDQAVAFGLHVANPDDELALLRKANIFQFTDAGRQNEMLCSFPNATPEPRTYAHAPVNVLVDNVDRMTEALTRDEEEEQGEYESNMYDHDRFFPIQEDTTIPPGDPFGEAFSYERDRDIPPLYESLRSNLTPEQHEETLRMYQEWRVLQRVERRRHAMHPVMSRLHNKLVSKLDIDPAILHYMRFPEFRAYYMERVEQAPRLEGYMSAKLPLYEWG
jgi:hypothetical protein